MLSRTAQLLLTPVMALCATIAAAQNYPNKPIHIITSEAGGGSDGLTRLIAQGISGPLGQTVIVDNRPSNVLGELASKAPADGYTLLLMGNVIWIMPLIRPNLGYDPVKDLAPLTEVGMSPSVIVVHPSLPVKSVRELIALAKARPGALNYASSGAGGATHLSGELFNSMAAVKLVNVPYKGGAPAMVALVGGEVQLAFPTLGSVMPHIKSGRLRAVAVTSIRQSPLIPGLPAVAETLPGYEAITIYGMFAPAGTPPAIITRLNQEIVRFMDRPEVKEKFFGVGLEAVSSSPEQFGAIIKSEIEKWGKVIRDAGIKPE